MKSRRFFVGDKRARNCWKNVDEELHFSFPLGGRHDQPLTHSPVG